MLKLHLISGDDESTIKNKARKLVVDLCGAPPENNPSLEIIHGDSDDTKAFKIICQLLDSLRTPPFLTSEKMIWFKHFQKFELLKPKPPRNLNGPKENTQDVKRFKEVIKELVEFLKTDTDDEIVLIIDGPNLDRRSSLYKCLESLGQVEFYVKETISDKNFVQNQKIKIRDICRESGKTIAIDAEDFLIEILGSDSGRLRNELEKLFCYIGERDTISLSDCRLICSQTPEMLSWAFTDALTQKHLDKALATINILMEQLRTERGDSGLELILLKSAIKQFQDMLNVYAFLNEFNIASNCHYRTFQQALGTIPDEIKNKDSNHFVFKQHPFRVFSLYKSTQRFSDLKLAKIIKLLLKTNRQLVSGCTDRRIVLEQLVTYICS